jgi:hypothetical protein
MRGPLESTHGDQVTVWTAMPEFDGVDLTESYVLGWRLDDQGLWFDLNVALVPGHRAYRPPLPGERTCWRQGILLFPRAREVRGLERQDAVIPAIDAADERDYGNIDTLEERNGEFNLSGDFGNVWLTSSRPVLTLTDPSGGAV